MLDMQIQEIGNHFNEVTTKFLMCVGSLSPDGNSSAFNEDKMLRLAEMYPNDFSYEQRENLKHELRIYIANIREDKRFFNMNGISNIAKKKMVETKKHLGYPLVYRLLKLALVLLVATASVERCFSLMKHVKTDLRNRLGDNYIDDACICYIEKEFFLKVVIEDAMNRFQNMKTRRE
ncbi:uncharacterized protein LOC143532847 [Bidens hawaiensis]|uniref:uncharacterized protein LOC143532847 n=1 Tax=Bidens hawaiensis TaxID=980011 RepID=UPI00404A2CCF